MRDTQRPDFRSGRVRLAGGMSLFLATLSVCSPAAAQERDRCLSLAPEWRVELPDGSAHDAKRLTLCLRDYWTPVSALHEIRIDGMPLGRFISRVGTSEAPGSGDPSVVFARVSDSTYRLLGYTWPSRGGATIFAFGKTTQVRDRSREQIRAALQNTAHGTAVIAMLKPR